MLARRVGGGYGYFSCLALYVVFARAELQVKYVSTRGQAPVLGFSDVLLAGLARDGGLYVPESWPHLSREAIADFVGRTYSEVALAVMRPFIGGEITDHALMRMCNDAYATFTDAAVAPLRQIGPEEWVVELFHGPTLAFKDVAMQLLARLMDHVLAERGSARQSPERHRATRAARRSKPSPDATGQTSSSCFRTARYRRCSSAR
jgi:threonine synthase